MRKQFLFWILLNTFVLIFAKYSYERGHCEALTIEFIAGLIWQKGKELIDPSLRNYNKNVRFHLFTRLNPYQKQNLITGDQYLLRQSNFNPLWPVRFSIHGWNGKTTTCSNAAIKDAYIQKGDYNIILVDWSDYALNVNYVRVVNEMFEISQQFVDFTRFLNYEMGVRFEDMYLIGHSAGCHIAGIAGKFLKPNRYGVIYSLDPSGPIHKKLNDNWRLVPSDAYYVESIQTDCFGLGFPSAVGHATFFPNWASHQPHCPNKTAMEPDFTCNHFGSLYYFVDSLLNPRAFGAIKCKSFRSIMQRKCGCKRKMCPAQVYMGGDPAVPKKGIFYFSTNKRHPFGYGERCYIK